MRREQQNIQPWIILGLLCMSVAYSAVAAYIVAHGGAISDGTGILWILIFAVLVALWAKNDAAARNEQKPFEYSYFVFLLWPVVLPYHLVKSRGIEGLLLFLGFLAIHELPSVVAITTWAYFGS